MISQARMIANIRSVFEIANDRQYNEGMTWYDDAHAFCKYTAKRYGVGMARVAAIVSALSPMMRWDLNKQAASDVLNAASAGLDASQVKISTFGDNKIKAFEIAKDKRPDIGTGYAKYLSYFTPNKKTQHFYSNIMGEGEGVTIDGHAMNIALFGTRRMGITTLKKKKFSKKEIARISLAYTKLSSELGIRPCQLQAVTWVVYRELPL